MTGPYARQRIENWVGDFVDSDAMKPFRGPLAEHAPAVLETLLSEAVKHGGGEPEAVEQDDLKHAMLEEVTKLDLPDEAREKVPALCAAFLEDLERQGRLAGGKTLGKQVGAMREAYLAMSGEKPEPIRNPGAKIGRNDPCPCGSGKKYKQCCLDSAA